MQIMAQQIMEKLEEIDSKIDGLIETIEILMDKETMKRIEKVLEDLRKGRFLVLNSIEEVKKVIGFEDNNSGGTKKTSKKASKR